MNSSQKAAMLAAVMFATMGGGVSRNTYMDEEDVAPSKPKKVIPAGCKEYSFYGFDVVAISEKSARKKCKKLMEKSLKK